MSLVKIDPYVSQIRDAVYGEEVRDAIINALLAMNDEITYGANSGTALPTSVKILGIGNSYTRDPFRWLWKILKEAGIKYVTVGHGYVGGNRGSIINQWASIIAPDASGQNILEYWKYDAVQNPIKTQQKSLQYILEDEDWDIVIFQNQSDQSGFYANWAPLYTKDQDHSGMDFIDWVDSFAEEGRKPKIGIFCPWTHHPDYDGDTFVNTWHSDPAEQEAAYRDVIPHVADSMSRCDFIVNGLDAINFARETDYLEDVGDMLLKHYTTKTDSTDKHYYDLDLNHLDFGIPQFLMGFCYAATLFGIKPSDIIWYPTAEEIAADTIRPDTTYKTSAFLSWLAKLCAYNASIKHV